MLVAPVCLERCGDEVVAPDPELVADATSAPDEAEPLPVPVLHASSLTGASFRSGAPDRM